MRSRPGLRYEVVVQLQQGDTVQVLTRSGDWLGIQAPPKAECWVASRHLADGTITEENAPLYSGPGIYFSTYRNLPKGTAVSVVRSKGNQWTQITPPPGTLAWVHVDYVAFPKPEAEPKQEPPATTEAAEPPPVEPTPPQGDIEPLPEAPANARVEPIGIPEEAKRIGYVIPLGDNQGPWTYALAHRVNDTFYPFAYLDKSHPDLPKWQWKKVIVQGKHEWLKGWPRPRLTIQTIELVDPNARD